MELFSIFIYIDMDKPAIVDFLLSNFWRKENERLVIRNRLLEKEAERLASVLSDRNTDIALLQRRIRFLNRGYRRLQQRERVLVNQHGEHVLFRRNNSGVFVQVEEDETETEDPEEIARRLGFEGASDDDSDEELMSRLLGFID